MILIGFGDILDLNKSEKNKKKTITAYLNLKLKDSHISKTLFKCVIVYVQKRTISAELMNNQSLYRCRALNNKIRLPTWLTTFLSAEKNVKSGCFTTRMSTCKQNCKNFGKLLYQQNFIKTAISILGQKMSHFK